MPKSEPFAATDEPLCVWCSRPEPGDGSRQVRIEYSSRGDRVPARLLLPERPDGASLLILAQPGAGSRSLDAPALCKAWVARGAALLVVDLPLHGERASAKLSERVRAGMGPEGTASSLERSLWSDFVQQAVADLRRGLAAAWTHPEVAGRPAGFAGFALGARVGTLLCAVEPRIGAAALAGGGAGLGPPELDPVRFAGEIAPRPVLFVNARQDDGVARASAERLHAAARDPKEVRWLDCNGAELPGLALEAMGDFLREHATKP